MAKSTLGSLLIDLQLNTSTLNKQVAGIDKRFNKMGNTFKKVGGALAGAFAVAGLSNMVKQTLNFNDALSKTADRLGIMVEDLQGLHFAAEQSGVSVSTLEMGMQRMSRRVSEAGLGTGEAVKALKELGIEASSISKMGLDQQFKTLADALAGVESEADQVRIAMKLFDTEGVKLLNMMKNGSAGLNEFQQEAKDLGFVLSRDMIAKMENANDSMNRVKKAGDGLKSVFAVALAPAISIVSTQLVSFIKNGNGTNGALVTMQNGVAKMIYIFDVFRSSLKASQAGWELMWSSAKLAVVSNFSKKVSEVTEATRDWEEKVTNANGATRGWYSSLQDGGELFKAYKKSISTIPPAVDKVTGSLTTLNKEVYKTKTESNFKDYSFVFTNAFSNMENAVITFAKTGKLAFSDFVTAILEDLLRMIIRLQITIPLMQQLQSMSASGGFMSMMGFSQGGAIEGGVQKFASGGVVSSPTVFPMATGMGLMGEAGAEAIMPLTRSANGDLGVKAVGGTGGKTVVNIYNESGADAEVSESTGGNGEQILDIMIKNSVDRGIGSGAFDGAFASNYGLSRKGY